MPPDAFVPSKWRLWKQRNLEMKQQRNRTNLWIEILAKEVPKSSETGIFPWRLLEVWSFDVCFGLVSSSKASLVDSRGRNGLTGKDWCFLPNGAAASREFGTNLLQKADLQQWALSLSERYSGAVGPGTCNASGQCWCPCEWSRFKVLGFFVR